MRPTREARLCRQKSSRSDSRLRKADADILSVSLADKAHNARAILRDLRKPDVGEEIFARFSPPKGDTLWYYRSLADLFCERLPGQLSNELREIVQLLEGKGKEAHSPVQES